MGTAATKAKIKYNSKNYERLNLSVPKGKKAEYQLLAQRAGKSLTRYITDMLEEQLKKTDSSLHI